MFTMGNSFVEQFLYCCSLSTFSFVGETNFFIIFLRCLVSHVSTTNTIILINFFRFTSFVEYLPSEGSVLKGRKERNILLFILCYFLFQQSGLW